MADGHLNKCIECAKKDVRKHRRDNPEKVRAYDRERASQPHRRAMVTANTAKARAMHKDRTAAHNAVARALKSGALVKLPCWVCGKSETEAHHPVYSMPLDVVWLCAAHHKKIHLAVDE